MVSQNPCISGTPQCARCKGAPDHLIHRDPDGHPNGHPFALTADEAVSGRLNEARARLAPGQFSEPGHLRVPSPSSREGKSSFVVCDDGEGTAIDHPADGTCWIERKAQAAQRRRQAAEPMQAQTAFCGRCCRERGEDGANLITDPTEPRRMHCSFGTGCWLESWSGAPERGVPFAGPRLHQLLADHVRDLFDDMNITLVGGLEMYSDQLGAVRLAIADALRARLRGLNDVRAIRAALDAFFRAPEVL